jgi:hypothetical protein
MRLKARLDRVTRQFQRREDDLAARLAGVFRRVARTEGEAAAVFQQCQAVIAEASLDEAATRRGVTAALIAAGYAEDGAREVVVDTPLPIVLAVAALGVAQVAVLRDLPETERLASIGGYLDHLGLQEGG